MNLTLYQVDAFTDQTFGGNPAAICPLTEWLPDELMQKIALENNLSETAFIVPEGRHYHIRWFTPAIEVDLCGHATLAAAHIFFTALNFDKEEIVFNSRSGLLTVKKGDSHYIMDFPADEIQAVSTPQEIVQGIGVQPIATFRGKDDYMVVLENQKSIATLKPNFAKLAELKAARGVIATAQGEEVDFVSRCFFPNAGINEDPVTGSAHTTMIPYWSKKLSKKHLVAQQISSRGGIIFGTYKGKRVNIGGNAITYLKGSIFL